MDSHKTAATSELQSLLEHRRRIAEGGPVRNDAFALPGRLSDSSGCYPTTARIPVARTLNGSTGHTIVQTRVIKPQPFAANRIATAVKAIDGRKAHLSSTSEDRLSSMSHQQSFMSGEERDSSLGADRLAKTQAQAVNGNPGVDRERFSLLTQADGAYESRLDPPNSGRDQGLELRREMEQLRTEVARLKQENAELKEAPKKFEQQLQELRAERDKYWEQSQASPSGGGGSESRLRSAWSLVGSGWVVGQVNH
eukprot:s4574_g2.t2